MEPGKDDDKDKHKSIASKPDITHLENIHFKGKHAVVFFTTLVFPLKVNISIDLRMR